MEGGRGLLGMAIFYAAQASSKQPPVHSRGDLQGVLYILGSRFSTLHMQFSVTRIRIMYITGITCIPSDKPQLLVCVLR